MNQEQIKKIYEALESLCEKAKEEMGVEILLGIGVRKGDYSEEGFVSSKNLPYEDAINFAFGINGSIYSHYGEPEDCEKHNHS